MTDPYLDFIARKALIVPCTGIAKPPKLSAKLKEHQRLLTAWALRRGRAAIFADTGLGKGWMILEWARTVAKHTGKPALVLAPLAVSQQFAREAEKLGVNVMLCTSDDDVLTTGVNVVNYQKLHKFDVGRFGGVALDEASILKSLDGKTRIALIEAFSKTPFRLAATATPSPNDHTELGGQAEFLGIMRHAEMLATFFINDTGDTGEWRLKGHAREAFWRWVSSWGAIVRMPSDVGCSDDGYVLPPIVYHEHVVKSDMASVAKQQGKLFADEAETLADQRAARRSSIDSRVARTSEFIRKTWETAQNTTRHTTRSDTIQTRNTGQKDSPIEAELQKKTASTCASTTRRTRKSGHGEPESSKTDTIKRAEKSTHQTLNFGSESKLKLSLDAQERSATEGCDQPLGSRSTTTSECTPSSADFAQSAADQKDRTSHPEARQGSEGSTLTTVTQPAESVDCYAEHATSESGASETVQIGSGPPQNTCKDQWVIWVDLNAEQDAIAKSIGDACVSIDGSVDDDRRVELYERWARGEVPVLISKVSIFGFGINMQHCHNVAFLGVTHSFEQFYQAVRRCWRFGQEREVNVHIVTSELEGKVVANLQRKAAAAAALSDETSRFVSKFVRESLESAARDTIAYNPTREMTVPSWVGGET